MITPYDKIRMSFRVYVKFPSHDTSQCVVDVTLTPIAHDVNLFIVGVCNPVYEIVFRMTPYPGTQCDSFLCRGIDTMNTAYRKVCAWFGFRVKSPPHYVIESFGTDMIEHDINLHNRGIYISIYGGVYSGQSSGAQCDSFLAEVSIL